MKIIKKTFLLILFFIFSLGFSFTFYQHKKIVSFPKIISGWYAKSFCSCLFVEKNTEKFCHNYSKQWIPIQSFQIVSKEKTISVKGLYATSTSTYRNSKIGCAINP